MPASMRPCQPVARRAKAARCGDHHEGQRLGGVWVRPGGVARPPRHLLHLRPVQPADPVDQQGGRLFKALPIQHDNRACPAWGLQEVRAHQIAMNAAKP